MQHAHKSLTIPWSRSTYGEDVATLTGCMLSFGCLCLVHDCSMENSIFSPMQPVLNVRRYHVHCYIVISAQRSLTRCVPCAGMTMSMVTHVVWWMWQLMWQSSSETT